MRLRLVRETEKARLYENREGSRQWVPRSICGSTLKFPPPSALHEVTVPDWWLAKNPWPPSKQQQLKI
jgi:hypothetical protein